MIYTTFDGAAAAGLLTGIVCLAMFWWQSRLRVRGLRELRETLDIQQGQQKSLREDLEEGLTQCRGQIAELSDNLTKAERNAQSNMDLLRDGRLGMPARARALRMLRSGLSAETAAAELGLARHEVQLLQKVSVLLAPRN
jgi:hypothetical protein